MNSSQNACFNLSYSITSKASLAIGYNDIKIFDLNPTPLDEKIEWFPKNPNGEELCIKELTKSFDRIFKIIFTPNINGFDNDMIALHFNEPKDVDIEENSIHFKPINSSLLSQLPFLIHWWNNNIDSNFEFENQWPFMFPRENWKLYRDFISFNGCKMKN
jgi:hypothetical protein